MDQVVATVGQPPGLEQLDHRQPGQQLGDFQHPLQLLRHLSVAAVDAVQAHGCALTRLFADGVQQGNVLTQEMVSQLKPGLTQDQVRFILGSPMLVDMFHANRWDYVYRLQKGKTNEVERARLSVFFDEGRRLIRVAGDVLPAEGVPEVLPTEAKSRVIDLQGMPRADEDSGGERGFFGRMLEKVGL